MKIAKSKPKKTTVKAKPKTISPKKAKTPVKKPIKAAPKAKPAAKSKKPLPRKAAPVKAKVVKKAAKPVKKAVKPAKKAAKPVVKKIAKPAKKVTRPVVRKAVKPVQKPVKKPAPKKAKAVAKPVRKIVSKPKPKKAPPQVQVKQPAEKQAILVKKAPVIKKTPEEKKPPVVRTHLIQPVLSRVEPPFESYKGSKPYLFASYSHKEMEEIFPIITRLHWNGYHIWYDEAVEPGPAITEATANAIRNCGQILVFLSPLSVNAVNVRNEINLALEEGRNMVIIYLERTILADNLAQQLEPFPAIEKFKLTESELYERLRSVLDESLND
jgi:hypothetical protein